MGISASAFLFQVTVLYPWNNQLTKQLNRMEKDIILLKNEKQNRNTPSI